MNRRVVVPGSFDPITVGHMDLVKKAANLFDYVVVLVMQNSSKNCMFDMQTRCILAENACESFLNVTVQSYDGLLCDFIYENEICAIVKGARTASDFDYENQLAQINRKIGECETIILPSDPTLNFCSSTFVREMIKYKRPIEKYVPLECLSILDAVESNTNSRK